MPGGAGVGRGRRERLDVGAVAGPSAGIGEWRRHRWTRRRSRRGAASGGVVYPQELPQWSASALDALVDPGACSGALGGLSCLSSGFMNSRDST